MSQLSRPVNNTVTLPNAASTAETHEHISTSAGCVNLVNAQMQSRARDKFLDTQGD